MRRLFLAPSPYVWAVDLQKHDEDENKNEYAGIGAYGLVLGATQGIVAWVLIPESEETRDSTFQAHVIASVHVSGGGVIDLHGKTRGLVLDNWTPLFLGITYDAVLASDPEDETLFATGGTVEEIYLNVYTDRSYYGTIYIDDITVYAE